MSVFGVILVRIFLHLDWIGRDAKYLSTFSLNARKYGPEELRIRTLFTQYVFHWVTLGDCSWTSRQTHCNFFAVSYMNFSRSQFLCYIPTVNWLCLNFSNFHRNVKLLFGKNILTIETTGSKKNLYVKCLSNYLF